MNSMQCQIQSHNCSQIVAACMDKECKNKKLSCWACLVDLHNSHQNKCVDINSINQFIQQERNNPPQLNVGSKQIVQSLEQLTVLISNLNKIIKEKIEKIKSMNLQEYLKNSNSQQGIEQWNKIIEGIIQYVQVDNRAINFNSSQNTQLSKMEEKQIEFIQQSRESIQNIINQISKISKNQMNVENLTQIKNGKLSFDANRKNADFDLIDQQTIKKTKQSYYTMAFAQEGFDPRSQSYAFGFHIQNLVNYLLIGIGNDEEIKSNSYLNERLVTNLGHGLYLINGENQIAFHHTDQEFQGKKQGIKFKTGDKIQIKYDHVTKVLEFRTQSDQTKTLRMPITDMTKILYPCVMCHHQNNQVQITEY